MTTKPIAIVMLNYNGGTGIVESLRSVIAEMPIEIVVVDNASSDGSDVLIETELPNVRLLRNARNTGFAAAANQGIRETAAPYVLLLNPDTTTKPGFLAALVAALVAHPRAAAVGALVRNPDGTVQPTKRSFPSFGQAALHGLVGIFRPDNPGTRGYVLYDDDFSADRTVDWVAMTATALRRDAFDAVGGFDERFFFFVEDVDLCKRFAEAGYEVWFAPGAEVTHEWGGSWAAKPLRFLWMHQRNLFRYVTKHYRGAWVLAYPFIAAGLFVRFMLLALRWLITRRSVPEHRSSGGQGSGDAPRKGVR